MITKTAASGVRGARARARYGRVGTDSARRHGWACAGAEPGTARMGPDSMPATIRAGTVRDHDRGGYLLGLRPGWVPARSQAGVGTCSVSGRGGYLLGLRPGRAPVGLRPGAGAGRSQAGAGA